MGCLNSKNRSKDSGPRSNNQTDNKSKQKTETYKLKILLLGDLGVGKTSLLIRYTENKFEEGVCPTINGDFKTRSIECEGKVIQLQIWDLGGKERYNALTTSFHRGANGVIIVYDISNEQSFKNVSLWLDETQRFSKSGIPIMLVGNKVDLLQNRKVPFDDAKEYASNRGLHFLEASAKSNNNVEELFAKMAQLAKNAYVDQTA